MIEAAGQGSDSVYTYVDYTLTAGQEVEYLRVLGSAALTLTGNELNNILLGGVGNDTLNGGGGNDRLEGRDGSDTFVFDTPLVVGVFPTIADLTPGADRISLDAPVFTAAGPLGTLAAAAFFIGSAAHDTDDRIIYNSSNGQLIYDADGSGGGAAVVFAGLSSNLSTTASDYHIA